MHNDFNCYQKNTNKHNDNHNHDHNVLDLKKTNFVVSMVFLKFGFIMKTPNRQFNLSK